LFQFLKGSIKSYEPDSIPARQYRFNSSKVRLKGCDSGNFEVTPIGFNSSKVRLKGSGARLKAGEYRKFQFLKGSIKSSAVVRFAIYNSAKFQFLKGSIKRAFIEQNMSDELEFQFLKGSIKRRDCHFPSRRFRVSIPQRFD